ncbi:histidine phosphatase family protein [Chelativorans sp. Marseille-P2723]|uniref:histidine phosphatase family protein n=1 Tax=Chelativorans sp. Marseille-P2723 TaxID=2709133 RepID=UPI00156F4250|nr:histidine phosphatase family protein [Chelativorans sp. Marseille-P2723]
MPRAAIAIIMLLLAFPANATEAGWALVRNGGQVVLINHANAPGTGDPANFNIDNCATQRNLSDRGRQQARRMGALFFARAAPIERILTSRYCRAIDTATFAFGESEVEEFPALDPLAAEEDAAKEQLDAIRERILDHTGSGNLLMVTHPSVITALTGVQPRDSEAIILSRSAEAIGAAARISFN